MHTRFVRSRVQTSWFFCLLAATGAASPQGDQLHAGVEVRTDLAAKVAGAGVLMEWGLNSAAFTTGLDGRAGSVNVSPGELIVVSIGEVRTQFGSTVGQTSVFADPSGSATGGGSRGLCRFVPEARMTHFKGIYDSSDPDFLTHDGHSISWYANRYFVGSSNIIPTYDFYAEVALLRGVDTIGAYFAYHQTTPPALYIHGMLIRSAGSVDLGVDAIAIAIGRETHDYSDPVVDVIHMSNGGAGSSFATILGMDNEFVYVSLEGVIPSGDTLLLIRTSGGGLGTTSQGNPQPVPIPPGGTGGGGMFDAPCEVPVTEILAKRPNPSQGIFMDPNPAVFKGLLGVQDDPEPFDPCEPLPPAKNETNCPEPPDVAEPHNTCGAEKLTTGLDTKTWDIVKAWTGLALCNDAGVTASKRVCWEYSGGMEFNFLINGVTVKGEIGKAVCKTETLGECKCIGTWKCDWFVRQGWQRCISYTIWDHWLEFRTLEFFTRIWTTDSGSSAIEQTTTCTVTTGNCPPG